MIRPRTPPDIPAAAQPPAQLPAWALPDGPAGDGTDDAFRAGAALHALDLLVRSEPAWAGVWRQRAALRCAAASMRLAGRREDENALRDAWHLRRPGDAPGPAGRILGAWQLLASRQLPPHSLSRGLLFDHAELATVAEGFGLNPGDGLAGLAAAVDALAASSRPAPFVAAAVASHVGAARPDAEMLAWWCADLVLAAKLRWPRPLPILMTRALTPAFRSGGGARLRPGRETAEAGEARHRFEQALCLALAEGAAEALRSAAAIARRADRLLAVAPKLRAKGAAEVLRKLLDEDAVPGTLTTKTLSRFGARRLFARLEGFEAVRELSGRTAFRLYGL